MKPEPCTLCNTAPESDPGICDDHLREIMRRLGFTPGHSQTSEVAEALRLIYVHSLQPWEGNVVGGRDGFALGDECSACAFIRRQYFSVERYA